MDPGQDKKLASGRKLTVISSASDPRERRKLSAKIACLMILFMYNLVQFFISSPVISSSWCELVYHSRSTNGLEVLHAGPPLAVFLLLGEESE